MKLVRTYSQAAHSSLFAPGEPLDLLLPFRAAIETYCEKGASHRNLRDVREAVGQCVCARCCVIREMLGQVLLALAKELEARNDNGRFLRPEYNFVPDTEEERRIARVLARNRGKRDYPVRLNLLVRDALRDRGIQP